MSFIRPVLLRALIALVVIVVWASGWVLGTFENLITSLCVTGTLALVQLVESMFLTPEITANRSGLHPALVIISLFFWGTVLGGMIGMILAVPKTAFFVAIWGEIRDTLKHALDNGDTEL